jgi:hypothetical protein
MERSSGEANDFLYESGTLGKLRIQLISFLLFAEKIRAELKNAREAEVEEIDKLIEHFEILLNNFATAQQFADKMIIRLNDEERKFLFQKLPKIQEIFGWDDKIDKDGNIKDLFAGDS